MKNATMNTFGAMSLAAAAVTLVAACSDNPFTVALVRPLRIIHLNPGDGQIGVSLDAKVVVTFSDDVVESSLKEAGGVSLHEVASDGAMKVVNGSIAWDAKTKTATLTPAALLAYSGTYQVRLGTGIQKKGDDTGDGHLPLAIDATFSTTDPPGLGIVSVIPSGGKTPVPRDVGGGTPAAIIVTFTEGVKQAGATLKTGDADGNIVLEDVTGATDPLSGVARALVDGAVAYLDTAGAATADAPGSAGGAGKDRVVTVTPAALPGYGTVLRLTLVAHDAPDLTGIRSDRATAHDGQLPACVPEKGYSCAGGNYVFVFAIEPLPPFSVVSLTPGVRTETAGAGAHGVAFDQTTVTAVFSEDVDCTSVTATSFAAAWDSTDPVVPGTAVAGALACAGATVTFTADAAFGYSRDVAATLTKAIRSARAAFDNPSADPLMGHLQADEEYRFSTVDPPEIRIVSVKPGSGGASLISGNNAGSIKDTIVITFSEGVRRDVEQLGANILVEDVTGAVPAAVDGALAWNAAEGDDNSDLSGKDNIATFTPVANWAFGSKVRVTFRGGTPPPLDKLRSDRATARGGQLTATQVYDLAVETLPDLYVKTVIPGLSTATAGAGMKNVPSTQQTVTAVFSEDVDCASVTAASFTVAWDSTDPVAPATAVPGATTCDKDTVTFTGTAAFGYSRDVLVTLTTAIRSARAAVANSSLTPLIGHLAADYPARFSTEDPQPALVVLAAPGPGSTGVPRTTTIVVAFDRAMDTGSFTGATFSGCDTVNDPACATNLCPPARLAFNVANDTVTCTPSSSLPYSAQIRVSLAGGSAGIRSAAATARGGWLAVNPDPMTYTFTVEDLKPLYVLATNFSGSGGFVINQSLEFILSDHVDITGVQGPPPRIFLVKTLDLATVIPAALSTPIACTAGNACKVVLTPSAPLDYGNTYMAVVLGGFPDGVCVPERTATNKDGCIPPLAIAGASWAGLSFTFTTESTPGLQVVATIPKDGDTGVALSPTLTVQFNNDVQFGTVTTSSICLTKGANVSTNCTGPLAVPLNAWTLKPDNKTVTTTLVNALDFNSSYTLVVTKDVFDKYGQTLTSYVTAAFMTLTSALIQDVVGFNLDDLEPPDSMYVRIRFTEAMDQATISAASIYLTYKDGFGETTPVPVTVTKPDAQTAVVTPDLHQLIACDGGRVLVSGNDAFTDGARATRLGSAGTVFDASYVGRVVYVGGSVNGYNGFYKVTGVDVVNPGVDQRLILSGASFPLNESQLDWSILEPIPLLPYATDYALHMMSTIKNAAGTKHVEALPGQDEMTFTVTTGVGPYVSTVTYENGVVKPANLFGATDVPVNSTIAITFSAALDQASVTNGTVYLEERRGADGVITLPNTLASATGAFTAVDIGKTVIVKDSAAGNDGSYVIGAVVNATTVTVTPNFASAETGVRWVLAVDGRPAGVLTLSADSKTVYYNTTVLGTSRLNFNTGYRLVLKGRTASEAANVLKLQNGSPVVGEVLVSFTTSPAMTVISNPKAGAGLNQMMDFTAIFSRDVNTASLTDVTFHAVQQGVGTLTALIATNTEFKNYVTLMPVPTFRPSGTGAVITITTGLQDYRGNPMPQDSIFTFPLVGSAPATNAIQMDIFTSIAPTTGQIAAYQNWVIQFPTNNNLRNIVAPSSFGQSSVKLVEDPSSEPTEVPLAFTITPNGNVTGDKVEFRPKRPLLSGKAYQLTLIPNNMSNMYRLAITAASQVYNFTGESVAPQLVAPNVTPSGNGQSPTAEVVAWFNEQINPATVETTTFAVRVNGTTQPISGRYRQEQDGGSGNWKVIFTPSRPLKYVAAGYDVVLSSGIKDAAGNAFVGQTYTQRFNITNVAPKLLSGTPTGAGVPTSGRIVYVFDAAIDPLTVFSPTTTTTGSILVSWQDACAATHSVYGCITMLNGGTQVIYRPAWPFLLPSSSAVTADLDETKVADLAGNLVNKNAVAPWSFTDAASSPIITCRTFSAAAGTVDLNFTDDMDGATVTPSTVMVFDVATGVAVTGALSTAAKKVTFKAAPLAAGDYGIVVTQGVKSAAGAALLYDFHDYVTVP